MDISTIQALGALVNSIGLPATLGVLAIIWSLSIAPAVARWIDSRTQVEKAKAIATKNGHLP